MGPWFESKLRSNRTILELCQKAITKNGFLRKRMFHNYWEKNKSIVSFIALLITIGTLFLSIPTTNNKVAENALENLRILWLLIITIGVFAVFWTFIPFLSNLEKEFKNKLQINTRDTISSIVILLLFWFLLNIWSYTWSLYKIQFKSLMSFINFGIAVTFSTFIIFLVKKTKERFPKISPLFFEITYYIVITLTFSVWTFFISNSNTLKQYLFFLLFYAAIIAIPIFIAPGLRKIHRKEG